MVSPLACFLWLCLFYIHVLFLNTRVKEMVKKEGKKSLRELNFVHIFYLAPKHWEFSWIRIVKPAPKSNTQLGHSSSADGMRTPGTWGSQPFFLLYILWAHALLEWHYNVIMQFTLWYHRAAWTQIPGLSIIVARTWSWIVNIFQNLLTMQIIHV